MIKIPITFVSVKSCVLIALCINLDLLLCAVEVPWVFTRFKKRSKQWCDEHRDFMSRGYRRRRIFKILISSAKQPQSNISTRSKVELFIKQNTYTFIGFLLFLFLLASPNGGTLKHNVLWELFF